MREQQLHVLTTKDSDTLNIMTIYMPLGVMSSFRDILELYVVRAYVFRKKGGGEGYHISCQVHNCMHACAGGIFTI